MASEIETMTAYYWQLSQRMESSFRGKYPNEDELEFMLRESKRMKKILSALQFSWNSYIPLFHGGFALYYEKIENPNEREKAIELSTKLVSFAMDVSKMSKFLMCMERFYHNQIQEMESLQKISIIKKK